MQYATLGKTGLKVSRLGFGGMRFPMTGSTVDRDKAIPMIHRAFERGVNYIDSAVGYCSGDSQRVIGEALKGWRDKIVVSTKNSHYNKHDDRPWWKNLEDSLERLAVECIDVYHFHGLRGEGFDKYVAGSDGQLKWMHKAQDQGLIRHIAFSYHGTPADLVRIAKTGEFSVVTLQYNLIDRSNEAVLPACCKAGLGVVVMGPVGGGRLGTPSEALKGLVSGARSVPEVALRFVLSNPNVTLALSGMNEMSQIEENVRVASRSTPLSAAEKRRVKAALDRFKKLADLYCTGCNYCMPCPAGVEIPQNFTALNYARVYQLPKVARGRYAHLDGKGSQCMACGRCMSKCPQNIDIISQLRQTVRTLDDAYGKLVCTIAPGTLRGLSLRGGRCSAELQCRLECRNLSDKEVAPVLRFSPPSGVRVDMPKPIGRLGPFGRKTVTLNVSTQAVRSAGALPLNAMVEGGLDAVFAGDPLQLGVAAKGASKQAARALREAPQVQAANLRHDTTATPRQRKANWAAARFAYDAKDLIVEIEAVSHFPADRKKHHGRHKPGEAWLGLSSVTPATSSIMYEKGCFLTLDLGGKVGQPVPVDLRPREQAKAAKTIRCRLSGSSKRRKVIVSVPWKLVGVKAPKAGQKISLDFGMMFAGPKEPWGACWGARRSVKPTVILAD